MQAKRFKYGAWIARHRADIVFGTVMVLVFIGFVLRTSYFTIAAMTLQFSDIVYSVRQWHRQFGYAPLSMYLVGGLVGGWLVVLMLYASLSLR